MTKELRNYLKRKIAKQKKGDFLFRSLGPKQSLPVILNTRVAALFATAVKPPQEGHVSPPERPRLRDPQITVAYIKA